MTIHDRLKLVIKWLIGTGAGTNQEAIGRLMGYTNKSSFSQILNDKVPIPGDFISRLCALDKNINRVWIEEETGDMILDDSILNMSSNVQNTTLRESESAYYKMYKEKDEENKVLIRENGRLEERLRTLEAKLRQLESQDKEPESPPLSMPGTAEDFIGNSYGDYGEGYPHTKEPTSSKKSSGGKI